MTNTEAHSTPNIESFDPLRRLLTRTLRLSPLSYGLIIFAADVLVDIWLGWRYDVFLRPSGTPGLLQDYTALTVDLVSNPVICGVYLWTIPGTTRLLHQLQEAHIFESDNTIRRIANRYRLIYVSKKAFVIILVLSILFALSQLGGYLGWLPWLTVGGYLDLHPPMSYARAPFWFLTFYALLYGMFNVSMTIAMLRRMFRQEDIRVVPLHPDRCGGLGSISQYSLKIAYVIGTIGLQLSAAAVYDVQHGTLATTYDVLVGIIAYAILAPLFFFWPLGTAHAAMQEAKDIELLRLAQQFDTIYQHVSRDIDDWDDTYEKDMKILQHLKELYQMAQNFPVWPFDAGSLRRFFTIVTAPVIPAIISIIVDIVSSRLVAP